MRPLAQIVVIAIILRVGLFLAFTPWCADIARDSVVKSDAAEYHRAAVNLLERRVFSLASPPDLLPDNVRTPLYPFYLAGVYSLAGTRPWVVLLTQIGLSVIILLLLFRLATAIADRTTGLVCAALYALCPLDIVTTQELLTESLFLLTLTSAFVCWLGYLGTRRVVMVGLAAFFMGLTALCRPIGLYLPVVVVLLTLGYHLRAARPVRALLTAVVCLSVFLFTLAPWVLRNHDVFGRWSFSCHGGQIMLNENAAAVIAHRYGVSKLEAQKVFLGAMKQRYTLPGGPYELRRTLRMIHSTNVAWQAEITPAGYFETRESLPSVHAFTAAQGELGAHIVRHNLGTYAWLSLGGVTRTLLMPPWQEFMRMTMPDVDAAELATDVAGRNWQWLRKTGWLRVAVATGFAGLMTVYALAVCGAAFVGWLILLRRQWDSIVVWSFFLFPAYFLALAGPNAVSRFRVALLPFMLPCAAITLVALGRLFCRRARRQF
jgi:4-amino-4-deoxy-L-arabinose transferase-like glycosyltransferase